MNASLPINKNKTQVSAPFRKHVRNPYYAYTLKMSRLFYIAQTELVRKSYQNIDGKKKKRITEKRSKFYHGTV